MIVGEIDTNNLMLMGSPKRVGLLFIAGLLVILEISTPSHLDQTSYAQDTGQQCFDHTLVVTIVLTSEALGPIDVVAEDPSTSSVMTDKIYDTGLISQFQVLGGCIEAQDGDQVTICAFERNSGAGTCKTELVMGDSTLTTLEMEDRLLLDDDLQDDDMNFSNDEYDGEYPDIVQDHAKI